MPKFFLHTSMIFTATGHLISITLIFSEASVIISQASGSRTIVYNPGDQEPLKASEFVMALKRMPSTFQWIHFEARPFVKDMLSYLLSDRKVRPQILYQIGFGSHSFVGPN